MVASTLKFTTLGVMTLLLAGCGEGSGWERVLTKEMFPYGNQRTAGSGVAYVLAKMMPEKELKLSPVEDIMKAVDRKIAPKAIQSASPAVSDVQSTLNKSLRK